MNDKERHEIEMFCANLDSEPSATEVIEAIEEGKSDFEIKAVRFISYSEIDHIMSEELKKDKDGLGSFNAPLLSRVLDLPLEFIDLLQEQRMNEAIGMLVIHFNKVDELQKISVRENGYANHFNYSNSNQEELIVGNQSYYVFDKIL